MIKAYAKSDIGKVREINQDYYYISNSLDEVQLYMLADGMGGYKGGEIASKLAIISAKSYIENNQEIIQNFTDAIYKGQQWVKEHTANEIATNIQSFFPDTSIEMLTKAIQTYKDIDAWNETPVLKEDAFNRLQEVISLAGELQKKAPYEKIVNNSYALKSIEYNK